MSNPDPTVPRPVPDFPNGQTWTWTEQDSAAFLDTADLFVPARAEQIATLVSLIPGALTDPADRGEALTVVELASGDGSLALAVLDAFPNARYLALDGSQAMLDQTRARTVAHVDRVETRLFRLEEYDWRAALPQPLRCVLSSLCVHHLDGAAKRQLFADLAARLQPGGTLLLADVVEPATPALAAVYARQYDEIVRQQSLARYGDLRGFARFQQAAWNYFAHDYGHPERGDLPSVLADQLDWLRGAGFATVDCFWLRAGHAIYGGYR